MKREILDQIGERVDRLITLDIRGRGARCPIMERLYPAARKLYGRPITAYSAEKLKDVVGKGDTVFMITGLASYGMAPETDGPVGAVGLGRALQLGLGARPVFITHERFTQMMSETAISGGFLVFRRGEIERAWSKVPSAAIVEGFPIDADDAKKRAKDLLAEYRPKALIAIEARGPNEEGIYHVVNGSDVSPYEAKMANLFSESRKDKVLTIGILDGCGIEIGFGPISGEVEKDYPRYATCLCGCKSGMHDATSVDIVLPAALSNWGAHGVAACLSALLKRKDVLHDKETESRMIRACANAGAMDGTTGRSEIGVDGLPETIQTAIIDILREIVECSLKGYATELRSY